MLDRVKNFVRRFVLTVFILAGFGTIPVVAADGVDYTMGSGDEVRVTVFGHADLSGKFQVDGAGTIALPLVGKVEVGGKTAGEAETAIVAALQPDYLKKPQVSVEILTYRPFYILGEVMKPGSYAYVNGMTVVNAIDLGAGYTRRARENNFYITRAGDSKKNKAKSHP